MAQKYIGIDLGTHSVKLAVVTAGFRGVQLLDLIEEPVVAVAGEAGKAEDADPYLPALQAALQGLRARGLLGESVAIALPPGTLSYRVLTFPFAEERRIAQTIAFEADGQFPVPLEQLAYGHVVVPAGQGTGRALMVATARERVDQLATIFKRAGSDLRAVTSGAMAIAQVVDAEPAPAAGAANEAPLAPVSLVVDLGHGSTELVIVGPKGPLAVRSLRRAGRHVTAAIAKAYGLDAAAAEVAKRSDGFVPHRGLPSVSDEQMRAGTVVAQAIEPIVREIEHTRMWLRSTFRSEVTRLVLVGGGARLGGLAPYLTEQTGLPCAPARLRAAANVRGLEGRDLSAHVVAIGAALGAVRRPLVQLHDPHAGQADASWVQERIASLAAIGVAVMAFGAIDTIVRVKALDAERDAYAAELAQVSSKVFGSEVAVGEVKKRLDEADGQDVTSLIPQRGALEVLSLLVQAATPSDHGRVPVPPPPGAAAGGEGEGAAEGEGEAAAATPPAAPAAGADAAAAEKLERPKVGVVTSDEMVFLNVDIRERKIELRLEAVRASAQTGLFYRLKDIACLSNIEKGKVKGEDRKTFDMSMDNNCYFASSLGSGESESSAEDDGAGGGT
ncbi:MAG: pilus assembly protein PilM [Nannocystaceae bacterium]|nr:pilus assembly protein PilM [Nannocystaceae bacterium]